MISQDPRFSASAVQALGGSTWISDYRKAALTRLADVAPATSSVEEWRYSRIDELNLADYGLLVASATERPALGDRATEFLGEFGEYGALVHQVDGVLVEVQLRDELVAAGVTIRALNEIESRPQALGSLLRQVNEPFGALNEAFAPDATVIDVPPGVVVERPILVIAELSDRAMGQLSFARSLIVLGALAEASVVVFESSPEGQLLHVPVTEIVLGEGAHLRFDLVQNFGDEAWLLGYQLAEIGRDASLRSFSASIGGDYSRLYSRAALVGEGAQSVQLAAYLGIGSQVQDFRTFQDHLVGRTRSELIFKGAVADTARSVYSGMIHMRKGARRSDASQTNRNLVLSEGAHADSVPNLDIEENDVRCSHASAVGPIDPEQLFYLESRGLPPRVAERLILLGFFDDLLAKVNQVGCATYIRRHVEERLAASTYAVLAS